MAKSPASLNEALRDISKNLVDHIELMSIRAQLCRAYYLELVEQGFKPQEALEICKNFQG